MLVGLVGQFGINKDAKNKDEELAAARNLAQEEEEHEHEQYAKRHRFYAKPTRLLAWGEVQKPRETNPHDLLIDLVQVAACFQIGHFVSHNIESPVALLGLCAFGVTTVNLWSDLLIYRSRFESASLYHSILDGLQALFFAATAHNISAHRTLFEKRHLHPFVFYLLATRAVTVLRLAEVAIVGEDGETGDKSEKSERKGNAKAAARMERDEKKGNAKAAARDLLAHTVAESAVVVIAFFIRTTPELCYILLASAALQLLWTVVPSVLNKAPPREMRVPVHLEYMFKRMGELVMLSLGETVLGLVLALAHSDIQLIAASHEHGGEDALDPGPGGEYLEERAHEPAPPIEGHAHSAHRRVLSDSGSNGGPIMCENVCTLGEHFTELFEPVDLNATCEPCSVAPRRDLAFVGAFILISTLVYMYHHVNPLRRHHHATRRSLSRGLIWTYSHWFLVLGIIGLATAIKEFFVHAPEVVPHSTVTLLGDTLGTCLVVLALQQILHPGYTAYVFASVGRTRRMVLFSIRLLLALVCFSAHAMAFLSMPGYQLLLVAGCITLVSAVLLAAEKSDSHAYKELWIFADRVLTGKTNWKEEAMAMRGVSSSTDPTRKRSTPGDGTAQPKGASIFNKPHSTSDGADAGGAGCLPCVPGGKKKKANKNDWVSLNSSEWQRLG